MYCLHLCTCCWLIHLQGGKVGQRKSETGELGPQGCMTVHSALKRLVFQYCMRAKVPEVDLLADLRYRVFYKTYTKGRGLQRKHETHKTFKRDDHVRVMCDLYGQGSAEATRTRCSFSLCVQCVSRGDEIRDLNWSQC
jgi:hypothetical protein